MKIGIIKGLFQRVDRGSYIVHIRKNMVYQINIGFSNFNIITPNSTDSILKFTGNELVHAIATCGVINSLSESDLELKYKKYALECQFDVNNGELLLSDKYKYFDPSEKRCLSYYRGMILGRLIADKRFDLNVFIHLSTCENKLKKILTKKNNSSWMNPDIIAWNSNTNKNDYYVWECKGNINGLINGKSQAQKIEKVDGNDVKAQIVSAVYPIDKRIYATVEDPIIKGEDIQLDVDKALQTYYNPIVRLIQSHPLQSSNSKLRFGKVEIDDEEYTFGLPNDIFECILNDEKSNESKLKNIVKKHNLDHFEERENMFGDFIYIK